jgi:hypothetical protein
MHEDERRQLVDAAGRGKREQEQSDESGQIRHCAPLEGNRGVVMHRLW